MDQTLKKKLLVLLLFICCLLSAGLLINADATPDREIKSVSQVDSLILKTLYKFGAAPLDLTNYEVAVDSAFQRKVFVLTVLKKFPETKLHVQLKKAFSPYGFLLPARVLFPEKDLRIHFVFKDTILRTLLVETEEPESK